jgi:dihydrofolate synthase/folylpolyglutamate synthase
MRYAQAIHWLYALEPRGMSMGLAPIQEALKQRGNPERACAVVHVAGTNGKGSVSAMLASVLRAAGLSVGLFTSPHLHRLVERFRVNGRSMPQAELGRRVGELKQWLARQGAPELTFFELCTLLAFEWFRDERCDVVVLEVGIGGRLDCTNVVKPHVCVITSVALDHQDKLGKGLAAIAREKAGIIKRGTPVISGVREPEAARIIAARARAVSAPLRRIDRDFGGVSTHEERTPGRLTSPARGQYVRFAGEELRIRLPLQGGYQRDNVACAVAALEELKGQDFPVTARALRRGLASVRWPGRLELVRGAPAVLCDAAHNPAACLELARFLDAWEAPHTRRVLLFGVLRDKDHRRMLKLLLPRFDGVVFVTPASSRALPAASLRLRFGGESEDDVATALRTARKRAGKRGLVVAAGSIFVMSSVRAILLGVREDPKIAL